MSAKYRIGVIGTGSRGEGFARQLYKGTSQAEMFGLCDIDADRLDKFCDYCGLDGARKFTDQHEFLSHPDLDAVMITTPDFTHEEVAIEAMEAGKHVYLEKPLAHTMEGCYRLLEAEAAHPNVSAVMGFNMRESRVHQKLKEILDSGVLGQIVHISGLEQLSQRHSAAFMRRWHRREARSGGFLNTKCSHDMDLLLWLAGHEHKVVRIASFGGNNVFDPAKAPATHCSKCPDDISSTCPYHDGPGFVFPTGGKKPMHKIGADKDVYGMDMCVYNADKDIVDNQTLIFEWDNGLRGSFNMQLFQSRGLREARVWGEKGVAMLSTDTDIVTVTSSDTGDVAEYRLTKRQGGHDGTDPMMLSRLIRGIESGNAGDSCLAQGLAATLLAIKADESRKTGQVIEIDPSEYGAAM